MSHKHTPAHLHSIVHVHVQATGKQGVRPAYVTEQRSVWEEAEIM